jgi:Flp pilus assembly protein TadG
MSDQRLLDRLVAAAGRFRRARGGNVAIIFAVALIPMVMATLGVIQYGLAVSARIKLNTVADAAALQAVSNAAVLSYVNTGTTGQANATTMFNTQAAAVTGVTVSSLNVQVTATAATTTAPGTLTATVAYSATVPSLAPGIFSNFTSVSGTSTATATLPTYINFYLLLDNSPSMGIGATAADITKIGNANGGCGFECHSPNANGSNYPGYTTGYVSGASNRLDALKTAVQTIITQAQSETVSGQYKFAVYTFNNTVTKLSGLTSNLSQTSTDVGFANQSGGIQLPTTDQGTQIADSIYWLTQNVVTSGSGNGTQSSPYQFVFLVTDGVEDHYFGYQPGSYDTLTSPTGTWNGSSYASVLLWSPVCTSLKTKGATVGVIYTTYANVGGTQYASMVAPFVNNIAGALQNCASSSSYFFQASDSATLQSAMQTLFNTALQQAAHLSQ